MPSTFGVYALLAAMPLFFASNLVIGRMMPGLVEPWTLAFWRWSLAALIVLPFTLDTIRREWPRFREAAGEIWTLAALGMFVCGGLVYVSLYETTATNATLIYAASALVIVLLDAIWFGKRLTVMRSAGLVVGFIGVAAIVLHGEPARLFTLELNRGDLGIAFCSAAWAVYSVMLRRERLRALPTLPLFTVTAIVGAVTLAPPMLWETVVLGAFPSGGRAWLGILGVAVFPSVLAFGMYQKGIGLIGPSVAGVFLYLIPVYGVALAVMLLGESFHGFHAAGLVLVVLGVVLATGPFGRRSPGA